VHEGPRDLGLPRSPAGRHPELHRRGIFERKAESAAPGRHASLSALPGIWEESRAAPWVTRRRCNRSETGVDLPRPCTHHPTDEGRTTCAVPAIPPVTAQPDGPVDAQDIMTKPTRARSARGTGALFRRVSLRAGALVGLVLVAAACSGGSGGAGVAQTGGGETTGPSPSPSSGGSALAFAQCMREHGITDFPDPDSHGGQEIKMRPGSDLDPHNPVFRSAQRACQSLMPTPSREERQQALAQALRFSQCMRAHGISGFPDPRRRAAGSRSAYRKEPRWTPTIRSSRQPNESVSTTCPPGGGRAGRPVGDRRRCNRSETDGDLQLRCTHHPTDEGG
jgi:hypothetical protein